MPETSPDNLPSRCKSGRLIAAATVALAFLLPAVVLIVIGVHRGSQASDQDEFHVPTIWQFATQWPTIDFHAYPAAMTPGYHLLMAAVARAGGCVMAMQLLTAAMTAGLLATLAWAASRSLPTIDAILLCLPAAWSPYILPSGISAVPHNLAWWGVLIVLLLALRRHIGGGTIIAFGLAFLALVLVRQIHVWTLAPMAIAAWLPVTRASRPCPPATDIEARPFPPETSPIIPFQPSWKRAAQVLLAALPAVAVLAWFVHLWGGLAPRTQEWVHTAAGVNFAAVAMILATFGSIGIFYLAWLAMNRPGTISWRWATLGLAAAVLIALIPPTSYDKDAGRWGGLWSLARAIPAPANRSPLIIALAGLGGFVIVGILSALRCRERWTLATALLAFTAAMATVNQAWQRYYEPLVVMVCVLGVATAMVPSSTNEIEGRGAESSYSLATQGRRRIVGRVILTIAAMLQVALTVATLK